jgi:hypothetical protein
VARAALRELREECAVEAEPLCALRPVMWSYADRIVRLNPVVCRWRSGEPRALSATRVEWVATDALNALAMPPANGQVIAGLRAFEV